MMSESAPQTCSECGARLTPGAETCDLCGWPVEALPAEAAVEEPPLADDAPAPAEAAAPGVFCHQCGWHSPPEARFCARCGTRLQDLGGAVPAAPPAVPAATAARPTGAPALPPAPAAPPPDQRGVSRQVGIIVGAGVLLVVALFLVTAVSKERPSATPPPATPTSETAPPIEAGTLPPLDPALAQQVGALEAEIEQLDGAARVQKQRERVGLLYNAGRLDHAALAQREIAEAGDVTDDWRRAGDVFYDWMVTLEGAQKVAAALQAVAAYQRVLEREPDNQDVRADMATAYLNSNNPMQGVAEVKRVLEANPDHLQARFNYGVMLSMIGRVEQAVEQFEHVKTLVEPDSRYYQQAEDAIRALQQSDG